jgi:hypothetical protein
VQQPEFFLRKRTQAHGRDVRSGEARAMKTTRNRLIWSRDELVVVLDLYFRLPRAKFDAATPEVIEVARLIDRTPAAVAKRLANYRCFDDGTGLAPAGRTRRRYGKV